MHLLSKTTLIIGGASSGKTKFAENLVLNYSSNPLYIATAQPHDNEMKRKIRKHQQSRITFNWETIEAYYDLAEKIDNLNPKSFDIVLVDCLTMWLTNHYLKGNDIPNELLRLLESIKRIQTNIVLVTNEIGYGVVPENKMAREFRDLQGELNQKIAINADNVIQVVAGLPVVLKGELRRTDYDN